MSLTRPALRPLRAAASCSRAASSRAYNPWPSKSHTKPGPAVPNPLPAVYKQTVVMTDGSTFTNYSTNPTHKVVRLTRDVLNNSLWAPGTDRRGDVSEEGRVGRFRRRFEGTSPVATSEEKEAAPAPTSFQMDDLSWMSAGEEEKISARQRAGPTKSKKKK